MGDFYNRTIGRLPMWGQIAFWAFVLFLVYKGYKAFKKWQESSNYSATVNQSQIAIEQLSQQGVHPTHSQAQYSSWANTLQGAFEGCSGAGDASSFWSNLSSVFKEMKNDADVYALIKAYGVRTIDKCGIGTGDFKGDLSGTLSEKFSGIEGVIIRYSITDINDILQKNGVTFKF